MARGGRPLGPGDAIAKPTRGKWRDTQGQYKTRQQGQGAVEIASVIPAAAFAARTALAARYPRTWRRYLVSI